MKKLLVILAVSLFAVPALATGPGGEGTQDQGSTVCCAPGVEGNCPCSCDDINNGGGSPSSDDINNGGGCPSVDDYQIGGCPAADDHQENCKEISVITMGLNPVEVACVSNSNSAEPEKLCKWRVDRRKCTTSADRLCHKSLNRSDDLCHKSDNRSEVIESLARREFSGVELCRNHILSTIDALAKREFAGDEVAETVSHRTELFCCSALEMDETGI